MRSVKLLLLFAIAAVVFFSCQKEYSGNEFIVVSTGNTPNITAGLQGRVIDEQGKPVSGAEVRTTNYSVFTNINGEFSLTNARLYDKAAFLQVFKTGYFTGSRTFIATAGQSHYVEVELLSKQNNGTINSTTGGTVTLSNGAAVTLPALAVVNKNTGVAYSGNVNVAITWIDPTSANLYTRMPGDLRGIDNNNTERGLQSFGMVGVELTSDAGESLQIATGKKASLKFPLPASVTAGAPAFIALWSFDESTALWKQEGTANKSGNFYEAEVSHFSFWNCDAPFPVVELKAILKDQNGQPLKHVLVKIKRTVNNSYTSAFTDSSGVVTGKVPSNESLVLEVSNSAGCSGVLYSQNIGPFTAAATINITVNISAALTATISGTAQTCSNTSVLSGFAELTVGSKVYREKITNGAFSFHVILCNSGMAATLVVTDSATSQQGTPQSLTLNAGTNNVGMLTACGTSVNQFINFTLGTTPYTLTAPGDSLTASKIESGSLRYTSISGARYSTGASSTYIAFTMPGITADTTRVTTIQITVPGKSLGSQQAQIPATITEYGSAGGFIAGNFSGSIKDSANVSVPIQCSFRVKRR